MLWNDLLQLTEWMPINKILFNYYQLNLDIYKFENTKYFIIDEYFPEEIAPIPNNAKGPFLLLAKTHKNSKMPNYNSGFWKIVIYIT